MTSPGLPNLTAGGAKRRKIHKLGPGTLVLGSVGSPLDMSCQLTEIKFAADADSEDPEPVLCGDTISGARTYTWQMTGTVFQDVEADGVIDYTWKNAGTEVPFKFVPDDASGVSVTGRVTIDPLEFGGEVNTKNKSEFEWGITGAPTFTTGGKASTVNAS